jgi:hypothetical protein
MILGHIVCRLIYIGAKLGIADQLKDGPKSIDELAKLVGAHPQGLYRVLRALASVGVFAETEDGRFGLTPLATPLRSDLPTSLRAFALMNGEPWATRTWDEIRHSVETNQTAFEHVHDMGAWEYFAQHPEASRIFNESMTAHSVMISPAVLDAYDFSGISKTVEVAGGQGMLLAAILRAYPQMSGIVLDLPQVIAEANTLIGAQGVTDRCKLLAGDMFESVPAGDAYLLKWVIHDWQDDQALTILRNIRRAIRDNGKLLLLEAVVPPGNAPHLASMLDMFMLVMFGGRERTEPEFRSLFDAAGFRLARLIPTRSPLSIIEGLPA